MTLTLFDSPELWSKEGALTGIYSSSELVRQLVDLERSVPFSDRRAADAARVNTSLYRGDPISRWVRYREGYSPELVRSVLARFPADPNTVLLDPMCGSGSSLVAGSKLGMRSVGFDVSPYAVLTSEVKNRAIPTEEAKRILEWLDRTTFRPLQPPARAQDEYLARYFPERNFAVLLMIREAIDEAWEVGTSRDLLTLAFLAILEECSNRRKDGNGLATRPSPVREPLDHFRSQVRGMVQALEGLNRTNLGAAASAHLVSAVGFHESAVAQDLSLAGDVGAVIFSPPYPNSFDYFESYKLELLFTGLIPLEEFGSRRRALVRSFRQTGTTQALSDMPLVEGLVEEVMEALPRKEAATGTRDGRTRLVPNLLRGYFTDMREVLRSCASVMQRGARVHVVVDQSSYAGVPVPTDLLLLDAGRQVGLVPEHLTLCRRAKTSGQQVRLQPSLPQLLRETIVTLKRD